MRRSETLSAARSTRKITLVAADGAHGSTLGETLVEEILAWLRAHTARRRLE